MKDQNELDDFFNFENNEKELIATAKRKSTIRMVLISGLVSFSILMLFILVKLQITPWLLNKEIIEKDTYYAVYGANIFVGSWDESIRIIGSNATAAQYKLLDGRPVYRGEITNDSNEIETHLSPSPYETYTYLGTKVMNFIHPKIRASQLPNDINTLEALHDHQLVEIALSFDKAYSLDGVKAMLPKELTLQWVWLDTFSEEAIDSLQTSKSTDHALTENEVIGFSMVDKTGATVKDPIGMFMASLLYGKDHGGHYKKEMSRLHESLNEPGQLNETTTKAIGAVVIGTKKELQQIQNEIYVRASSIGATIDSFK